MHVTLGRSLKQRHNDWKGHDWNCLPWSEEQPIPQAFFRFHLSYLGMSSFERFDILPVKDEHGAERCVWREVGNERLPGIDPHGIVEESPYAGGPMYRLSTIILLAVVLPQKCDFGGDAARRAETEIRPYFPEARASRTAGGRTLRTITCTNLGRKAIELLPPTIDPKIQDLKSGIARMLTGITTFELGFQEDILRLDLPTGRYNVVSASSSAGYSREYDTACKGAFQVPAEAQIYVGRFRIVALGANGEARETEIFDTLGIYRPEEFNSARDFEVEARRRVIDSELRRRGLHVVGIELLGVGRITAPAMQPWQFAAATEGGLNPAIR